MKWGLLNSSGHRARRVSLPLDDESAWAETIAEWGLDSQTAWAISTVNPPAASRLEDRLREIGAYLPRWYRSAIDVPMGHDTNRPSGAGADRAMAVLAAKELLTAGIPAIVISCGTAITIERITADGVWDGGAIAAGLDMTARALNNQTAQLPRVETRDAPHAWGNSTETALAAGVFWGTVGTVRELVARQEFPGSRTLLWTGGSADVLARAVEGSNARVVPDLMLAGVAFAAFGVSACVFLGPLPSNRSV